jgi:hypothetical protein
MAVVARAASSDSTAVGSLVDLLPGARERAHCISIIVPANAHLDGSGHRWLCDLGFESHAQSCTAIEVPSDAYADYEPSAADRVIGVSQAIHSSG